MTQLERLEDAFVCDIELPTLSAADYAELVAEVQSSELSEFDQQEILIFGRYKGRGFGVDNTL